MGLILKARLLLLMLVMMALFSLSGIDLSVVPASWGWSIVREILDDFTRTVDSEFTIFNDESVLDQLRVFTITASILETWHQDASFLICLWTKLLVDTNVGPFQPVGTFSNVFSIFKMAKFCNYSPSFSIVISFWT